MRSKVVSSDGSDQTGLILYNVGTAHNSLRQRGIYVVQGLNYLNAARIREVSNLSHLRDPDFASTYGGTGACDISELLFVCNAEFKKTSASYRPRMFIFTSEDDPCGTDRRARKAAVTRANDFHEGLGNGAEINLIPLKTQFDIFKFWDQIILYSSGSEEGQRNPENFIQSSLIQLEEMNQVILRKIFKKRPLNRVNLSLVPDDPKFNIALMVYTSYFPAAKPRHIYVDSVEYKPLKSDSKYVSDFTGAIVNQSSAAGLVGTFFVDPTTKKRVKMSRDDLVQMRDWVGIPPGVDVTGCLNLVGFKPLSVALQMGIHSLGHSCFMYPQDNRISGSGVLVAALIDRMVRRDLCAICTYIPKSNSQPIMAALIPQKEQFDEDSRQEKSPGFFLIRLPFVEDVRPLSLPDTNVAHVMRGDANIESIRRSQVDAARKIVQTISEEEWEPSVLDNPALQQCYVSLEAMALNLDADQIGSVEDLVGPDPAKINRAASESVDEWLNSLKLSSTEACAIGAAVSSVKKEYIKKEEDEPCPFTMDQIRELHASGRLGSLTVGDLKSIIKSFPDVFKNVSTSGRKPELLEKIRLNIL